MRLLISPRPGIDRARILCERGDYGYLDRIFGGRPGPFALTKHGN
jgi:hypothetical protein